MFKDFSDWVVYEGFHEGSGRSEKIWLKDLATNQIGLFKFKKDLNTKDYISEKLASELAALLGIPSAHVEIGIYKGREGSMSFLINKGDEALIEGIWLINELYPNYSAEKMYDDSNEEYYSLEMIVNSIEKYGLLPELLKMLVFDYLIGNSDRHQNNWAIISKGEKTYTFSPLYDNSSSLCCYVPEDKIPSLLGNDKNRWNALVKTKSRSIVRLDKKNKKTPTHEEVLKYICDNDRYFKYVYELLVEICKKITIENLDSLFAKYPVEILSEQRKELIKRFLIDKIGIIREMLNRKEA